MSIEFSETLETYFKTLEDVMGDCFGRYSKYIIQDRAIPDARDGLKPVQRRILYAMFKEGNHHDKSYRKSAKAVGVIIGNYHPHGDSSVYDALVRLSQDFKLNHPLVDMQGNNGSIDGDEAAAMRYTEARLSPIAMQLLENVNKNTVLFAPNFDDTELEPTVLPAYFPNILVNGSTGISAGYATNIPSHNLKEIIDATIYRINKPTCELNDLLKIVKGPDFCTGGIIQGRNEIKKAYQTGKGRIVIRGKINVSENRSFKIIKISEIPYEVNKAELVKKMDEIRADKVIDGFVAIRDESDRNGLSIVIELKKDTDEKLVLNYLYKNTDLQIYYSFNMVAIVNRKPMLLGLMPLLDAYIEHQKDVLTRLSVYELAVANKRIHIVAGLIKAVDVIDEVINIIRKSINRSDSITNLITRFAFSQIQAEAIVDLRLYRLSNTDINVLENEYEELQAKINHLTLLLNDSSLLNKEIINKLNEVKNAFTIERRSLIENDIVEINIDKEDLITEAEVMISISKDGYVKRSSMRSYQSNNDEFVRKEDDFIFAISKASTLDKLLVFLDDGTYAYIPVYELLETKWKDFGKHLNNYVQGVAHAKVVNALLIDNFDNNLILVSASKSGLIKTTYLKDLAVSRYNKVMKYFKLKNDDLIIDNQVTNTLNDVILTSNKGYMLRFNLDDFQPTSPRASGVKAMRLNDDYLIGCLCASPISKEQVFIICDNGQTKRMPLSLIEKAKRATKGKLVIKNKKTNPDYPLKTILLSSNSEIFITDNTYRVKLLKAYDTPLSNIGEGMKKSIDLAKNEKIIDACIINDLHLGLNNDMMVTNVDKNDDSDDIDVDVFDYNDVNNQLEFDLDFEEF
ncbi:MAG: DNA topoisomerase IV subunit A [Bacilli bacterium]|jgi:topoisomerase-4 subunit A|nr:DNA topoisomerase IV subunit A [Bacilli bacterium]